VFDKGTLEDGEGRQIDFKNTIIVLTSNVGSETIMNLCADPETKPEPEALVDAIRAELLSKFPAALLGRLVVVPFYPISEDMMRDISRLQLNRIIKRFHENHGAELVCGDDVVEAVVRHCNDPESGARAVDRILTHSLLPRMSAEVLSRMATAEDFSRIVVGADESGEFTFTVS
jgi:type VI secretion system protein VasG